MDKYYKESGKIGLPGIVLMAAAGLIASAILGAIYGYAIFYIPFIYLNFFITIFFGVGVGLAIGKTGYFTKVRNRQAVLIFGLVFGIIAGYFGWIFWIHAASEQTVLDFNPENILTIMGDIAENGAWSMFGWTPTGAALYIIWAIEGLIIIIASIIFALSGIGRQPFCEECENWTEETTLTNTLEPIGDPGTLISGLEKNNIGELTKLKRVSPDESHRTKVQLLNCPECGKSHYLTLEDIKVTVNDKGETKEDETTILENLILTNQSFDEIRKWGEDLNKEELRA